MFYVISGRIMHDKTLSADSKLLLGYLLSKASWEERNIEVNSEDLSVMFNTSINNIRKILTRLYKLNFITLYVDELDDGSFIESVTILDKCFESEIDRILRGKK